MEEVPTSLLTSDEAGDYPNPQTFWFNKLGNDVFRRYYANYAAAVSADYSWLTRNEFRILIRDHEINWNSEYIAPSVWGSVDQGTNGEWVRPAALHTCRGWAWNVFNITNTKRHTYRYLNILLGFISTLFIFLSVIDLYTVGFPLKETLMVAMELNLSLLEEL